LPRADANSGAATHVPNASLQMLMCDLFLFQLRGVFIQYCK